MFRNIFQKKNTKSKYYDITELNEQNATYNYILSERSAGKSYQMKKLVIDKNLESGECFFLLRRYAEDIANYLTESYFGDMYHYIKEASEGRFNSVVVENKCFYLCFLDEDGKKNDLQRLGYIRSLSQSGRYKSTTYSDVTSIVFEEFIDEKARYLPNEIDAYTSVLSTVARDSRLRVYMIGNMLDRTCPYFYHHQLVDVPKQKAGTIAIYKHSTGDYNRDTGEEIFVTIAVEIPPDTTSKKTNEMFVGNTRKNVTKGGSWSESEQPTIKLKDNHIKIYTVFFEREYLKFIADFYIDSISGDCFWWVSSKETPIRLTSNMRLISDRIYNNPMCTNSLTPLSNREGKMFEYFRHNKVYYSTNLTGTEFKRCLTWFRSATYLT